MSEIKYLKDRDYANSLREDLGGSITAHLSTVRLTRNVEYFFGDWLRAGNNLYVVTNSVNRFPEEITSMLEAAASLSKLGADVAFYHSPYLLHQKLLALAPDIVYMGSHNFTGQSMGRNIERSLRIQNLQLYNTVTADIKQQGGFAP